MLAALIDAADDTRNFEKIFIITLVIKTNGLALGISQDTFGPKNRDR